MTDLKGICKKCTHYGRCKKPCRFAELYLADDNLAVWSKKTTDKNGREIEIIYSRSRERQQCTLSEGFDNRGRPALTSMEQQAFSTENENPFAEFKPKLLQTGIFIDRFFNNYSYKDLATKYDLDEHDCIKRYSYSVKRLIEVLKALDGQTDITKKDQYLKRVEESSGKIPKGQKWFLLNKLFGLRPAEIAEMEGKKGSSSVRQLIIRVSDQLKAGEISLIEVTPEEAAAAKSRLDTHRRKRRERYSKFLSIKS